MPSTLSQPSASPRTDSSIGVERSNELVIPPARNAVSVYLEQTTGQNNAVAIGTRLSDKQLITVDKNGNMFIVSNDEDPRKIGKVEPNGDYILDTNKTGNIFGNSDIRISQVANRSFLSDAHSKYAESSSIIATLRKELTETGMGVFIVGIDQDLRHLSATNSVAVGNRDYAVAPKATWINEITKASQIGVNPKTNGLTDYIEGRFHGTIEPLTSKLQEIAEAKKATPTLTALRVVNLSVGNSISDLSGEIHSILTHPEFGSKMAEWKKEIFGEDILPKSRNEQFAKIQDYLAKQLDSSAQVGKEFEAYQLAVSKLAKLEVQVVVAAGNVNPEIPLNNLGYAFNFAAMSANVISVAASNTNKTPTNLKDDFVRISGQETTFRGVKYQPTLSAPGEYIRTLIPIPGQEGSKGLYIENGSTLSTAIVSGTIALMVEANPKISVSEIKNLLIKNSVDTAISDKVEGAGMLDIVKAVKSAR